MLSLTTSIILGSAAECVPPIYKLAARSRNTSEPADTEGKGEKEK